MLHWPDILLLVRCQTEACNLSSSLPACLEELYDTAAHGHAALWKFPGCNQYYPSCNTRSTQYHCTGAHELSPQLWSGGQFDHGVRYCRQGRIMFNPGQQILLRSGGDLLYVCKVWLWAQMHVFQKQYTASCQTKWLLIRSSVSLTNTWSPIKAHSLQLD